MVMQNIPMYQAKIPIRGGGGVIDLSSKENETTMLLAQAIGEALGKIYGPGKRQRQERQQISQISPILSREGDQATNIRDALAAIQAEQRPTGVGGVLDRLNPLAPARGGGSEIEQMLLSQQMGQQKSRQGRLVKVGGKWVVIDPTTNEIIKEIPTPPPSGVKLLEEYAKGTKAAAGIEEAGTRLPPEVLDTMLKPMEEGILGRAGFEEGPGREVRRTEPHWYLPGFMEDWLAPDITAAEGGKVIRPRKRVESKAVTEKVRKKTPITEALGAKRRVKAKERPPKPKEYPDAKWSEEHQMWTIVKNGRLMGVK